MPLKLKTESIIHLISNGLLLQKIMMNIIRVYLSTWHNICISLHEHLYLCTLGNYISISLHGRTSVSLYYEQLHLCLSKWRNICISILWAIHLYLYMAEHMYLCTMGNYISVSPNGVTSVSLYFGQVHLYISTWHNICISVLWASTSLYIYMAEHLYLCNMSNYISISLHSRTSVSLYFVQLHFLA
ncbi:hypothetical protein BDB01DRAFT_834991 [Pilobolus umbonatus]|nr:hypothetical protein BDB01DRAFT_834991 [Pilobolus umbonatus]